MPLRSRKHNPSITHTHTDTQTFCLNSQSDYLASVIQPTDPELTAVKCQKKAANKHHANIMQHLSHTLPTKIKHLDTKSAAFVWLTGSWRGLGYLCNGFFHRRYHVRKHLSEEKKGFVNCAVKMRFMCEKVETFLLSQLLVSRI